MTNSIPDQFHWYDFDSYPASAAPAERYQALCAWALAARGQNPEAFDGLTCWLLDSGSWMPETLEENRTLLVRQVVERFQNQNAWLRARLRELEPEGVVNPAVFPALDRFDQGLAGALPDCPGGALYAQALKDFTHMLRQEVREEIAGMPNGPTGTDTVERFGYFNFLKDMDAGVQWALFMPDCVKRQQEGFQVESFQYRSLPALRFIGREEDLDAPENRRELFQALDGLGARSSDFAYDLFFMHHYGLGVDVERMHGFWGRFFQADTPVPEGFAYFDLVPQSDGQAGPPYLSQFAFATFSGSREALHGREGYDSDAMYDVTRNIILGQGVHITYPDKYWTAEVFLNGWDQEGFGYLFSVER